jgi:hypothetical protein
MENKYKKIIDRCSIYTESDWVMLIEKILYVQPLDSDFELILDYPAKTLQNLNTVLQEEKAVLLKFHDRLFDVYKSLSPHESSSEIISMMLNLFSGIKLTKYVYYFRKQFIDGALIGLNWNNEDLHIKLLATISDFDNFDNDAISDYLFENVEDILLDQQYSLLATRYFIKNNSSLYFPFIDKILNYTTDGLISEIFSETFDEYIESKDYKSVIAFIYQKGNPKTKIEFHTAENDKICESLSAIITYDSEKFKNNTDYSLLYMLLNKRELLPVNIINQFFSFRTTVEKNYIINIEQFLSDYFDFSYSSFLYFNNFSLPAHPYSVDKEFSLLSLNVSDKQFVNMKYRYSNVDYLELLNVKIFNDDDLAIFDTSTKSPTLKISFNLTKVA